MPNMASPVIDLCVVRHARRVAHQRQTDVERSCGRSKLAEGLHAALCEATHLSPSSRAVALLSAAMLELREDHNMPGDVAARGHELLRAVTATLADRGELAMNG